jgi:hypothetical protein
MIAGDIVHLDGNTYKRTLLNVLMMGLFIGLPLIWSGMMGWVGVSLGHQLSKMITDSENTANSVGNKTPGPKFTPKKSPKK